MPETTSPEAIAQTVMEVFGGLGDQRPTPDQIETEMRPFGVLSSDDGLQIMEILLRADRQKLAMSVGAWVEANIVVSGEPAERERRIAFLVGDTCTCVLAHLPNALKFAIDPVDPRILTLKNHPDFPKE